MMQQFFDSLLPYTLIGRIKTPFLVIFWLGYMLNNETHAWMEVLCVYLVFWILFDGTEHFLSDIVWGMFLANYGQMVPVKCMFARTFYSCCLWISTFDHWHDTRHSNPTQDKVLLWSSLPEKTCPNKTKETKQAWFLLLGIEILFPLANAWREAEWHFIWRRPSHFSISWAVEFLFVTHYL